MNGQPEHLEQELRRLYADAASTPASVDGTTAADVISRGRARRRRTRITAAGVAAAVALLAAVSVSVVPRLAAGPPPATEKPPPTRANSITTTSLDRWIRGLPAGPAAQAAWADGDVLHVESMMVPITGSDVTASSRFVVHGRTPTGWLVSRDTHAHRWLGVVHPNGSFVQFALDTNELGGRLLVAPDGSRAVVGDGNRGVLIDTTSGRVIMPAPDIGGSAWTSKGVYGAAGPNWLGGPYLWKPGHRTRPSSFDPSQCTDDGQLTASLIAGYHGCTIPQLVSVSPDGTRAVLAMDMLDLPTGQKINFLPTDPWNPDMLQGFPPDYAVLWEDNEHVLIEFMKSQPLVILRCNAVTGSCERASGPIYAPETGLAPLQ